MTNTIASVLIVSTLVTNWTGVPKDGRELGYLSTNQTALVTFRGKTTGLLVADDVSTVAVWRNHAPEFTVTNYLRGGPWLTITNLSMPAPLYLGR